MWVLVGVEVDCVLADFSQSRAGMGQSQRKFSWVRLSGHAGVLFWTKTQVLAIIPHLDNITQVPWAQQGLGQTKPEHAVPKLLLRCYILSPRLCRHETTHASPISSLIKCLHFYSRELSWRQTTASPQLFARRNFTCVIPEVISSAFTLANVCNICKKNE